MLCATYSVQSHYYVLRPTGTFSIQVGTSQCGGRIWHFLIKIGLIYLPKVSEDKTPLSPYIPPGLFTIMHLCNSCCNVSSSFDRLVSCLIFCSVLYLVNLIEIFV